MLSASTLDVARLERRVIAPAPAIALVAAALAGALAAADLLPLGRHLRNLLLGSLPFDVVPTTIVAAALQLIRSAVRSVTGRRVHPGDPDRLGAIRP